MEHKAKRIKRIQQKEKYLERQRRLLSYFDVGILNNQLHRLHKKSALGYRKSITM